MKLNKKRLLRAIKWATPLVLSAITFIFTIVSVVSWNPFYELLTDSFALKLYFYVWLGTIALLYLDRKSMWSLLGDDDGN